MGRVTVSLIGEIERLIQQKQSLLEQASEIDRELERVKLAIQGVTGTRIGKPPRDLTRELRPDGSAENAIFAALAAKEPRTLNDIAAYSRRPIPTLRNALSAMVQAGRLYRATLPAQGNPSIYARTKAALGPPKQSPPAPNEDDELGIVAAAPSGASPDAALSTSDRGGSHA